MNDSKTAFKSREQLVKFLGIFSPHISKPTEKFVGEMLFGIQASQDTLLSEIGRSLREDIKLKKTEERLCRHLAKAGLDEKLHLGRQLKLGVLAEHIAKVSKRMFDVPEFFYYAIADGLKWLFVSHGKWRGPGERFDGKGDLQMELEFADG